MKQKHMKTIVTTVLAAFLSVLLLPSCGRAKTIDVGVIVSTRGPSGPAAEGVEFLEGLRLAVEEINGSGGINGRKLNLIHRDPELDPEQAKGLFREMEENERPLFYLSTLSFMSMALASLAEEAGVVLVGTMATTPKLTENARWVYRFWPTADMEVPVIIDLLNILGVNRLGAVYLNDDYGTSILGLLEREFARAGKHVTTAPFPLDQTDFTEQIRLVQDSEAVYFVGFPAHTILIAQQLEKSGYAGLKIAANSLAIPSVRQDSSTEGIYTIIPVVYNPGYIFAEEFRKKYEDRYGKPFSHYAPPGYDLLMILKDLLTGKAVDRESVRQYLAQGFMYSGVFGDLELRPGKHDISFPLYPALIRSGKVVYR